MKKKSLSILTLSGLLSLGLISTVLVGCNREINETNQTYSITSGETNGATLVFSSTSAHEGDIITVVVQTPENQEVDTISADGVSAFTPGASNGTYTFTMPAQNVVVNVTLKRIYELRSLSGALTNTVNLSFSVDGSEVTQARCGDVVTVRVLDVPETQQVYEITGPEGVTFTEVDNTTYTFTMIDADVEITVVLGRKIGKSYEVNAITTDGVIVVFNESIETTQIEEGTYASFAVLNLPAGKDVESVTATTSAGEVTISKTEGRQVYGFTMPSADVTVTVTLKTIEDHTDYYTVSLDAPDGFTVYLSGAEVQYSSLVEGSENEYVYYDLLVFIAEVPEGDSVFSITYGSSDINLIQGQNLYAFSVIPLDNQEVVVTSRSQMENTDFNLNVNSYHATAYFEGNITTAKPNETVRLHVEDIEEGYEFVSVTDNSMRLEITQVPGEELIFEFVMPFDDVFLTVNTRAIVQTVTLTIQNNTSYQDITIMDAMSGNEYPISSGFIELQSGSMYMVVSNNDVELTLNGEILQSMIFNMPSTDSTLVIDYPGGVVTEGYTLTFDITNFTGGEVYIFETLNGEPIKQINSGDAVASGTTLIASVSASVVPEGQRLDVRLNGIAIEVPESQESYWEISFEMPDQDSTISFSWVSDEESSLHNWTIDGGEENITGTLFSDTVENVFQAMATPIREGEQILGGTNLVLRISTQSYPLVESISINGTMTVEKDPLSDSYESYFAFTMPNEDITITFNSRTPNPSYDWSIDLGEGETSGAQLTLYTAPIEDVLNGIAWNSRVREGEQIEAGQELVLEIISGSLNPDTITINGDQVIEKDPLSDEYGTFYILTMPNEALEIVVNWETGSETPSGYSWSESYDSSLGIETSLFEGTASEVLDGIVSMPLSSNDRIEAGETLSYMVYSPNTTISSINIGGEDILPVMQDDYGNYLFEFTMPDHDLVIVINISEDVSQILILK